MPCKCVECGGRIDCDSIICTECLAEIIEKVNSKSHDIKSAPQTSDKVNALNV